MSFEPSLCCSKVAPKKFASQAIRKLPTRRNRERPRSLIGADTARLRVLEEEANCLIDSSGTRSAASADRRHQGIWDDDIKKAAGRCTASRGRGWPVPLIYRTANCRRRYSD